MPDSKKIPHHLRLHKEENDAPSGASVLGAEVDDRLLDAFREVTGFSLSRESQPAGRKRSGGRFTKAQTSNGWRLAGPSTGPTEAVIALANAIQGALDELEAVRREVRKREAELAANVPVRALPDEEPHLSERLRSVLRCGAEAIGCQAAALYMLDAATSELKLRSSWGLPSTRYLDEARPLADAVADLEALAGHAVVLETESIMEHWSVPEFAGAAICVPVSTPTIPLGTLWIFSAEPREFSSLDTNVVEVVAGRVAADLERHALLLDRLIEHGGSGAESGSAVTETAPGRLPHPDMSGWEVEGESVSAPPDMFVLHDWFGLADSRLAVLVLATAGGHAVLQTVRTAFRCHAYNSSDLAELATLVDETVWECGLGDWSADFALAAVDAGTDVVEWVASRNGLLWVQSAAKCATFSGEHEPLGRLSAQVFKSNHVRLQPGESAALVASCPPGDVVTDGSILPGADEFLPSFASEGLSLATLLTRLRKHLAMRGDDHVTEAGGLAIIRRTE